MGRVLGLKQPSFVLRPHVPYIPCADKELLANEAAGFCLQSGHPTGHDDAYWQIFTVHCRAVGKSIAYAKSSVGTAWGRR